MKKRNDIDSLCISEGIDEDHLKTLDDRKAKANALICHMVSSWMGNISEYPVRSFYEGELKKPKISLGIPEMDVKKIARSLRRVSKLASKKKRKKTGKKLKTRKKKGGMKTNKRKSGRRIRR